MAASAVCGFLFADNFFFNGELTKEELTLISGENANFHAPRIACLKKKRYNLAPVSDDLKAIRIGGYPEGKILGQLYKFEEKTLQTPSNSSDSACQQQSVDDNTDQEHSLATRLQDVGQQVWHGSLLLSDYIVHHSDKFTDKVIIDLGAGVGLTSIVTAMYASTVYSTDVGNDVLTLNEDNIVAARTFPTLPHPVGDILVKELDWFQGLKVEEGTNYGLSTNDINNIYNSNIVLAADVIYDFDITDAFFITIKQIMSHPPEKTLYISLEKRMVFTVEYLAVTSPAYNYFCGLLDKLENESKDTDVEYKITKCDLNFQQYFQYNKTKYLELWCVSTNINTL